MHRSLIIILLLTTVLISSCRVNRIVNGQQQGKWIYITEEVEKSVIRLAKNGFLSGKIMQKGYNYKGRFNKGKEVGIWRYYLNGKLVRKEKYNGEMANVRFYHENGKIESEGKTWTDNSPKHVHWYYSGNWNFYDTSGSLVVTRQYEKGEIINEVDYKNNKEWK